MKNTALLIVAGLATAATAQTMVYTGGAGGAFPDNGTAANPLTSTITIGDTGAITDLLVELDGAHERFDRVDQRPEPSESLRRVGDCLGAAVDAGS